MKRKAKDKARLRQTYLQYRLNQLKTYGRDNVWEDGVRTDQYTGGGAVYGHHALAAYFSARASLHFLDRYKGNRK